MSANRRVRIARVLEVSSGSRAWAGDPRNRRCDAGGWFCPGQYPPELLELSGTQRPRRNYPSCPVVPRILVCVSPLFWEGCALKLNQQKKGAPFFPMATGHLRYGGWTKSISHHQRNPGMLVPRKYQPSLACHGFQVVQDFVHPQHSMKKVILLTVSGGYQKDRSGVCLPCTPPRGRL